MKNGKKALSELPKGIAIVRAKGRVYVYAWRGGPRLYSPVGSAKFFVEYEAALANRKALPSADTIAGLILEYRASRAFRSLAAATRKDHERAFPDILKEFGSAPLRAFDDPRVRKDIRRWHETYSGDRQADKRLGSLSRLLSFAMSDGHIATNPALGIEPRYQREAAPTPISEADLAKVLESPLTPPEVSLVIGLMARSGLARADAATLLWSQVKADRLDKRRVKSRTRATPPMTQELAQIIASAPRHAKVLTVLTDARGKPWRADGLGKAVSAAMRSAGLDHTAHDLRASYACYLMRLGATDEEAAEALGWSLETIRQVRRHYVDDEAIFAGRIAKFSDRTRTEPAKSQKTDCKTAKKNDA